MPVPTLERELHTAHDLVAHLPPLLSWPNASTGDDAATTSAAAATPIPGGITNLIFKLSPSTTPARHDAHPVLVRVFGAPDIFPAAARARETALFAQLAARGLAPRLHAVFANGRVEQFIPDAPPLALEQMTLPSLCAPIARRLARLHAFVPHGQSGPGAATLFGQLHEWATHIEQAQLSVPFGEPVQRMHKALRDAVESVGSPTVFAHNDLLAGNILRGGAADRAHAGDERVTLIDFEYAGWNYRGFDVANFFAECMGGTQDGVVRAELYPDERYRHAFCLAYLQEGADGDVTEEMVASLMREVRTFDPVTHLYWGLWGVVQSEASTIDFPYMEFARQRLTHCLQRGRAVLQAMGKGAGDGA